MPMRKTWLHRLPQILGDLSNMGVPVLDRAVFEKVFGVRPRRAIQLMHFLAGTWQAGPSWWTASP